MDTLAPAPTDDPAPLTGPADPPVGGAPPTPRRLPRLATLRGVTTAAVVGATVVFVLAQFHPDLLLSDTTPAGGDMGAHVWSPAYLRDHLLPDLRLAGWTMDWYAGFPAMQFYMVVPMLAIVLLSAVVPYGVAFKLVTVSGVATLPVSAYLFSRLARQPFPVPALTAVAAAAFVFDRSFSIYGGNAASTLAGEFAFSISLSLALTYLGVVGRGLAEGTHRAWAAALLALCGLCHVIPLFFAIGGTVVWFLVYLGRDVLELAGSLADDRRERFVAATRARCWWLLSTAPVAGLLVAFWMLPFYAKSHYLNDMGWERINVYHDFLFWREDLSGGGLVDHPTLALLLALALAGGTIAVALRNRAGVALAGFVVTLGLVFASVPEGRLWNTRLLGFYYLSLALLGATGVGLVPTLLTRVRARRTVGLVALVAAVGLQVCLVVQPQFGAWPVIRSIWAGTADDLIAWAPEANPDRWLPYVLVGLGLATLCAAAEVAGLPSRRRRVVAWSLVAAVVGCQVLMQVNGDARAADRLLGWTAGLLVLVAVAAVAELFRDERPAPRWLPGALGLGLTGVATVTVLLYLALPLHSLGLLGEQVDGRYQVVGLSALSTADDSFVDSWAAWNYRGYEAGCDGDPTVLGDRGGVPCTRGRKRFFPEYHAIVTTMAEVGETHGCGRAMWEYASELDGYGTPMALMLLPHWTDGCIGSMEGLYFEASTTTPYHFINQDEVSQAGSNAQRGMPYVAGAPTSADFDRGIEHLQMHAVRYYMAYSEEMRTFARAHPALTEVATSPAVCLPERCPPGVGDPPERWAVFLIEDSEMVVPLTHEPVVLTGLGSGHTCDSVPIDEDPRGRECEGWLDPAVDWYVDPELWSVPLAESGPAGWARVSVEEWLATHEAPATPLAPVEVSDIEVGRDEISFRVDQVGVPVLVRTSYFPNWKADGAAGPWRVTPNLMVVVPTDTEVRLHYGYVAVDVVGWLMSLTGLGLLVVLVRRGSIVIPPGPVAEWRRPRPPREPAPGLDDPIPGGPDPAGDAAEAPDPEGGRAGEAGLAGPALTDRAAGEPAPAASGGAAAPVDGPGGESGRAADG